MIPEALDLRLRELREEHPAICWQRTSVGRGRVCSVCILPRGHDDGVHERREAMATDASTGLTDD